MYTARHLSRRLRRGEAVVTLVDPRGFMTFQPFLAEAAAGAIEPRHAVTSLRRVLPGTEVLTGRITRIDHAARRACFQPQDGTAYSLSYDVLVLVPGSVSRTLPIPGLAENAVGFKNLAEAIHLRNHVLAQLDNAASVQDPQQRQRALTFVVVGGGFAGVEALAELQAMAERACKYYPSLSPRQMHWVLVEATSRILPDLDLTLGQWTIRTLRRRGIQVRLGTKLVSAEGGHIVLDDGTELDAGTLVWTVGGTANPLASASDLPVDEVRPCPRHRAPIGHRRPGRIRGRRQRRGTGPYPARRDLRTQRPARRQAGQDARRQHRGRTARPAAAALPPPVPGLGGHARPPSGRDPGIRAQAAWLHRLAHRPRIPPGLGADAEPQGPHPGRLGHFDVLPRRRDPAHRP